MSLRVQWTSQFKKDYKSAIKKGLDISKLDKVITMLSQQQSLTEKYKDHALSGNWKGFRECHIEPDWLLIYAVHNGTLTLTLARTGSHGNLF